MNMNQATQIKCYYPPYGDGNSLVLPAMGRSYAETAELIERRDRAASGKLRWDIIADKKTFTLSYDTIDDAGLNLYDDLYGNHAHEELILEITKNNATSLHTVKMLPYARERVLAVRGGLWSGVSVAFEEV